MKVITDNLIKALGIRLRDARIAAGLSQKDVFERSGIDAPSISRLEAGTLNPGVKALYKLTQALGIELSDLFSDVAKINPNAPRPPGARQRVRK